MIKLGHYNDGKEKWQSHEIMMLEDDLYNPKTGMHYYDLFGACGYGSTKEEALNDFIREFKRSLNELKAFETMLDDLNFIANNIVNIDCFGKEIKD